MGSGAGVGLAGLEGLETSGSDAPLDAPLNMPSGLFMASSPDITLTPRATESTCIMRGSDM